MKRVVVITGASRGLGLSLAQRFLKTGDTVYGISRTSKYWKQTQAEVGNHKNFRLEKADITREDQVKNLLTKIRRRHGQIDILINNAGYGGSLCRIEDLTSREYEKSMKQNLTSAFLMAKYVIGGMRKKKRGLIINVSSMAGQRAVPRLFAYSAGKFGMVALSQALAKENDDIGRFKAITICPGGMNTKMRADLFGQEDAGRQQTTDYVAGVIWDVIRNKIKMESGGDIVIRHGKITAIHGCPGR